MPIKYYQLTKGDRAKHGDEIHTFNKIDGMYALWENENNEIRIGSYDSYELGEDGIFYPVINK